MSKQTALSLLKAVTNTKEQDNAIPCGPWLFIPKEHRAEIKMDEYLYWSPDLRKNWIPLEKFPGSITTRTHPIPAKELDNIWPIEGSKSYTVLLAALAKLCSNHGVTEFTGNHHRAVMHKSPSKSGKIQLTTFDENGFYGHTEHENTMEAVKDAARSGFMPTEHPELDNLCMTEKFQNGVNASMVIQWENEFRGHLHLLQTFHEQGFEAAKKAYRSHKTVAKILNVLVTNELI